MIKVIRSAFAAIILLVPTLACAATLDVSKLNKASSFVTSGGENANFKRVPQKTLWIGDRLYFITMITWEPVGSSAGRHTIKWLLPPIVC